MEIGWARAPWAQCNYSISITLHKKMSYNFKNQKHIYFSVTYMQDEITFEYDIKL